MADEKDRFGETMKLVERAKEDIYFAERDRELIEKRFVDAFRGLITTWEDNAVFGF